MRVETVFGQDYRPSFYTFNTNKGEVLDNNLLKVKSKPSYLNYIPSNYIIEQKIQKIWKESQNKEVAKKRWNEEIQHITVVCKKKWPMCKKSDPWKFFSKKY